ncbi:Uncharacterised protein [Vibrio cholerae]|nr:Uncharacterised protein [Vibrio cholerae]
MTSCPSCNRSTASPNTSSPTRTTRIGWMSG